MTQKVNVNWNVDYYKTDHESDEHWNLRKKFMEVHKNKFSEDEIVCLAQVFTNVEFMGCKYPDETMRLVGELSQEVAKEFRAERSKKLKRTFVKASDAAEARAKVKVHRAASRSSNSVGTKQNNNNFQRVDLMEGLKYGNFIVYLTGGRDCLRVSAAKCAVQYTEKDSIVDGKSQVEIRIGNTLVARKQCNNIKTAKAEAFEAAMGELRKHCYFIKANPNADCIHINKTNDLISADVKHAELTEKKIDSNNIGFKMMKMMGWSGGGLGSQTQGRQDPVGYLLKTNRSGLGSANKINKQYFQDILYNYLESDDVRDLKFEPTFTKEDRASLHEIAGKIGLKSSSHGKGKSRSLVISKKSITYQQILKEVLLNKAPNYCNKFFVQVPNNKAKLFPMHTEQLDY